MANNIIKRVWNQNRIVHIDDLRGMLFQAESGGHTFQISGIDDAGNVIALSGSVAGVFMRPDNTDVAITGSASGGVVSVTLPAECYSVPGRFGLTVFVTDSGQKTAVYAAIGTVSRTSSGTVSPGTTADVVDLINQINAAVATIPASWTGLMADIAPTYSDAAVYPVGAYVYYNGDLYRCTTAITTAESWTAGHWTAAVLGNDVSELKSALDNFLYDGRNLFSHALSEKGYNYVSGNLTVSPSWDAMTEYIPFDSTTIIKSNAADATGDAVEVVRYGTTKSYVDTVMLNDQNGYSASLTGVGYFRIAVNKTKYNSIESVVVMAGGSIESGEPYGKNLVLDDGGYLGFSEIASISNLEELNSEITEEIPRKFVELPWKYYTFGAYVRSGSNPIFTIYNNPAFAYCKIKATKGDKFRCTFESDQNTAVCAFGVSDENDVPVSKVNDGTKYYINHIFEMPIDGYFYVSIKVLTAKTNPFRVEKYVSYTDAKKCVSCVGDSLTQGNQDRTGVTYPNVLQSLLTDYIVKPHGCGGDNAIEIAAMTDGYTLCVNPFTIPGDTSEVVCTLSIPEFDIVQSDIARQNDVQLRFCKVGDVYGNFKWNGNNTYKFSRIDGGTNPVILDRPTAVRTMQSFEKDYTTIIWAGTNNPPSADAVNDLIEKIDTIISQLTNTRYVVIGLTAKSINGVEAINQILGKKYGKHFLDIRKYILTYGLEDVNITPTEQDLADIAEGQIPTSLRTDNVHLNQHGYTIVGTQVYTKGKSLGYW